MLVYVAFLLDVACQKLLNSADVSRSYSQNKTGTVFLRHGVYYYCKQKFLDFLKKISLSRTANPLVAKMPASNMMPKKLIETYRTYRGGKKSKLAPAEGS